MHRSYYVEDTGHRFVFVLVSPKVKVKSEIMYFLVNASPPKRLGVHVETSNFTDALVSSKASICDGVPSTEV